MDIFLKNLKKIKKTNLIKSDQNPLKSDQTMVLIRFDQFWSDLIRFVFFYFFYFFEKSKKIWKNKPKKSDQIWSNMMKTYEVSKNETLPSMVFFHSKKKFTFDLIKKMISFGGGEF